MPLVRGHIETAPSAAMDLPPILLLTELFPPAIGGSPVLFGEIYSRLSERLGLGVTVLTDSTSSPLDPSRVESFPIVRRPIATDQWGIRSLRALRRHARVASSLRWIAAGRRKGLVHCGRALPEGVAALMGYGLRGWPYVCWCHGEDLETARASRELTFVMKRVYGQAAGVLANSRNTKGLLVDLGVPSDRIDVVYPGVDAERFHPVVNGDRIRRQVASDADVMLLSVGRLQRRKGHDLTIRAVARLRDQLSRLRYVIVGDGDERASLTELARQEQIADRVTFVGSVAAHDLPAYYAACDIFVTPNRIDGRDLEGFGIVFLEAAATGKPTIGGSTGGVPEAVEDGVTGLLVSGTDVEELAESILRLASKPELRQRFGHAGRDRVLRDFTWDRAADAVAMAHVRAAARSCV